MFLTMMYRYSPLPYRDAYGNVVGYYQRVENGVIVPIRPRHRQRSANHSSAREGGRAQQQGYESHRGDMNDEVLPARENAVSNHESRITTMSDIMNAGNQEGGGLSRSQSFHQTPRSPKKPTTEPSSNKRDKSRPPPLDLNSVRRYATVGSHMNIQPIHNPITPDDVRFTYVVDDGTSSVYSPSTPFPFRDEGSGSPLRVPRLSEVRGNNVLQVYNNWRENVSEGAESGLNVQPGMKASAEQLRFAGTPDFSQTESRKLSPSKSVQSIPKNTTLGEDLKEPDVPPFTPLTPWLMGNGHTKKVSKTMIGDKGWLEDTAAQTVKKPERQKMAAFFNSVKKTARRIVSNFLPPFYFFYTCLSFIDDRD